MNTAYTGALNRLVEEFGKERVIDSPISEAGITGLAAQVSIQNTRVLRVIQTA